MTKLYSNGAKRKYSGREGGPCTKTRLEKMSAFCLFFFHLPWYQIGCYSKNLVPRNECAHAWLKGLLFYVFNWISLYLIAIKFVCLCFLESKMCMFSASVWEGKTHKKQSMVLFVPLFSFCDLDKWKSSKDRFDDGKILFEVWSEFFSGCENVGSMSESDQLHTYPSPGPTLTLTCYFFYCCLVRGGVGVEFLRYWHWLLVVNIRIPP